MAMSVRNNIMDIFREDDGDQPIWFECSDVEGKNHIATMKFRDAMLTVNKLIPDVINCKYLKNEKCILLQTLKKHREDLNAKKQLGNIPCIFKERLKLNTVKGTINHPSISETNDTELLEDLKQENKHIVDAFIFKKFNREQNTKVNTTSAVITFDLLSLPPEVKYLKYTILKTRIYYPNPMRCFNCYRFGHTNTRDRPCSEQRLCGKCGDRYHLNQDETCTRQINCSNCNGAHEAWSIKCPVFKDEKRKVEIMTDNRCGYKEAAKIFENQDNRVKSFSTAAKKTQIEDDQNMKKLDNKLDKIMEFTEKLGNIMNMIVDSIPHLRIPEPTSKWLENSYDEQVMVVEDSQEENDDDPSQISPTYNQHKQQFFPSRSDAQGYYTVDFRKPPPNPDQDPSIRGTNNPPPQFNRADRKRLSNEQKKEDKKSKKGKQ